MRIKLKEQKYRNTNYCNSLVCGQLQAPLISRLHKANELTAYSVLILNKGHKTISEYLGKYLH